jgi:predicted nucleic acid-binding protein
MSDRYLLDTNIALYLLGGRLVKPLPVGDFYMSIISEMELLSYPSLSRDEALRIQDFLSQVTLIGLSDEVKTMAIALRKKYRLKLPDAIICATASFSDAMLLSNDVQLGRVTEIRVETVEIR